MATDEMIYLRFNEALTQVGGYIVLHGMGHFVRTEAAQCQDVLEVIQCALPVPRQLLSEHRKQNLIWIIAIRKAYLR